MILQDWQKEMLAITVAYRMVECGDRIPMLAMGTKWERLEETIQQMYNLNLIEPSKDCQKWVLSGDGRQLLKRICGMIDAGLNFEIFGIYNFEAVVDDEWWHADGNKLKDNIWDPRFNPAVDGHKEDLRIAMMMWMSETLKREGKIEDGVDPRRIIYLRHLANGEFRDSTDDFLDPSNIKRRFQEVEDIVRSAYKWQDLVPDNEDEAFKAASAIYSFGMIQLRKEEGPSCSGCATPLAMFGDITECPECHKVFGEKRKKPQNQDEYECPKCESVVHREESRCGGCGARLNFSLPEGTVKETTTEYREYYASAPMGTYYGYIPCGWYDPWNPVVNAAAFGVLCGAILS